MKAFDASDPSSPREVAAHKTPAQVGRVFLTDDAAHVAAYEAGLMVLALEADAN